MLTEKRSSMLHGVLLITLFSCAAFYIGDMGFVKSLSLSPMIVGIFPSAVPSPYTLISFVSLSPSCVSVTFSPSMVEITYGVSLYATSISLAPSANACTRASLVFTGVAASSEGFVHADTSVQAECSNVGQSRK